MTAQLFVVCLTQELFEMTAQSCLLIVRLMRKLFEMTTQLFVVCLTQELLETTAQLFAEKPQRDIHSFIGTFSRVSPAYFNFLFNFHLRPSVRGLVGGWVVRWFISKLHDNY